MLDYFGWCSYCYYISLKAFRNYTTRADNRIIAYHYPRQKHCARPNYHFLAKYYITRYVYARRKLAKVANPYVMTNGTVKIQEYPIANFHVICDDHARHNVDTLTNLVIKRPNSGSGRYASGEFAT